MEERIQALEDAIERIIETGRYEGQSYFCELGQDAMGKLYDLKRELEKEE